MLKLLSTTIVTCLFLVGCSSQDMFNSDRFEVIESPAQQAVTVYIAKKFEESDGVLPLSNSAASLGPQDHLPRYAKQDMIGTRYYFLKNNSNRTISGMMSVNVRSLKSESGEFIHNFQIGPNKKLLFRKIERDILDIKILKANFID